MRDYGHTKIDAIFVFADSRDWAGDCQIIPDLAMSKGGYIGTLSETFNEGPPIYFPHNDVVWSAATTTSCQPLSCHSCISCGNLFSRHHLIYRGFLNGHRIGGSRDSGADPVSLLTLFRMLRVNLSRTIYSMST
jgi:hypothetical protein